MENVLNSKSEYSWWKVPRLMINKEEWGTNSGLHKMKGAQVDMKKVEEDIMTLENALLEGGAAWDIGIKGAAKKRKMEKPVG